MSSEQLSAEYNYRLQFAPTSSAKEAIFREIAQDWKPVDAPVASGAPGGVSPGFWVVDQAVTCSDGSRGNYTNFYDFTTKDEYDFLTRQFPTGRLSYSGSPGGQSSCGPRGLMGGTRTGYSQWGAIRQTVNRTASPPAGPDLVCLPRASVPPELLGKASETISGVPITEPVPEKDIQAMVDLINQREANARYDFVAGGLQQYLEGVAQAVMIWRWVAELKNNERIAIEKSAQISNSTPAIPLPVPAPQRRKTVILEVTRMDGSTSDELIRRVGTYLNQKTANALSFFDTNRAVVLPDRLGTVFDEVVSINLSDAPIPGVDEIVLVGLRVETAPDQMVSPPPLPVIPVPGTFSCPPCPGGQGAGTITLPYFPGPDISQPSPTIPRPVSPELGIPRPGYPTPTPLGQEFVWYDEQGRLNRCNTATSERGMCPPPLPMPGGQVPLPGGGGTVVPNVPVPRPSPQPFPQPFNPALCPSPAPCPSDTQTGSYRRYPQGRDSSGCATYSPCTFIPFPASGPTTPIPGEPIPGYQIPDRPGALPPECQLEFIDCVNFPESVCCGGPGLPGEDIGPDGGVVGDGGDGPCLPGPSTPFGDSFGSIKLASAPSAMPVPSCGPAIPSPCEGGEDPGYVPDLPYAGGGSGGIPSPALAFSEPASIPGITEGCSGDSAGNFPDEGGSLLADPLIDVNTGFRRSPNLGDLEKVMTPGERATIEYLRNAIFREGSPLQSSDGGPPIAGSSGAIDQLNQFYVSLYGKYFPSYDLVRQSWSGSGGGGIPRPAPGIDVNTGLPYGATPPGYGFIVGGDPVSTSGPGYGSVIGGGSGFTFGTGSPGYGFVGGDASSSPLCQTVCSSENPERPFVECLECLPRPR